MAKRAAMILLNAAVWTVCASSAHAQAAASAAGLNAMSTSTAAAAGRSTGAALNGAFSQVGAATQKATQTPAQPGAGANGANPPSAAGAKDPGAESKSTIPPATVSSLIRFTPPIDVTKTHGVPVGGPMPNIHFDTVSFQTCNGSMGSTKADLPMDGDYVAFHCQPIFRLISFAYEGALAGSLQLAGYPAWVETDLYDFHAKVSPEDLATWQKLGLNERRAAIRGLLGNVLKLKVKADTAQRNVYLLSTGEEGPQLKTYADGESERLPNGLMLTGKDMSWVGRVAYFQGVSMEVLADSLSAHLDRKVVDRTGLTGSYDFSLPLPYGSGASAEVKLGESIPSVAEELAGLGLKLEAARVDTGGLVIQHIERPAN